MMTLAASAQAELVHTRADARARGRDAVIDTMRGVAILMVIGIHSVPQPLDLAWTKAIDAALRPCVPIFLFASGYLTARAGRVPLFKRLKAAVIPYTIAFIAAYLYMTLHNPAMDHRVTTTVARFALAYVFVYYYVFVYIGCTIVLWLIYAAAGTDRQDTAQRMTILLALAIGFGLVAGSYLDPLLFHLGFADSFVEEVRMRDIPFWFSFMALGALTASFAGATARNMRSILVGAMLFAYLLYLAVRLSGVGDAAVYDSTAFFLYAALFSVALLGLQPSFTLLASLGSGSYFIYLWHIFIVMLLRDHAGLRQFGSAASFAITFGLTAMVSIAALGAVRQLSSARVARWLGA
ncbi:acyltransferase [Bradyrhizobium sp. Leo170]|uniref:acyltransferase family protein n=1 Tax=Bradyrhizobium sp. Leo170 TaxID=1571199 RepID=UPI001FE01A8A|nr:acyltransferase [Bradyrhizobium sp. Leo170]